MFFMASQLNLSSFHPPPDANHIEIPLMSLPHWKKWIPSLQRRTCRTTGQNQYTKKAKKYVVSRNGSTFVLGPATVDLIFT